MSSSPPGAYDADHPFITRRQHSYSFSGRVLLTAVVILAVLTLVFVLIRLLLFQLVLRGRGGGGLAAGVRRSFARISSGSRRHGLDAAALAALPVTAYRTNNKNSSRDAGGGSSSDGADCAVCLAELSDGEKVRALPGCGHVFHVDCVDAWLRTRTTCPVCRAEVAPAKDAEVQLGAVVVTVEGEASRSSTAPAVRGPGQRPGTAG